MSWNRAARDEIFTPFSRLPPIGSTPKTFKNIKPESKSMDLGTRHQTFPLRKRKLTPHNATSKSSDADRLLIRRKTYIVLEPVVCKSEKLKYGKKSM